MVLITMKNGTWQVPTWRQYSPVAASARTRTPEPIRGLRNFFVLSQFIKYDSNKKRPQRICKKGIFCKAFVAVKVYGM